MTFKPSPITLDTTLRDLYAVDTEDESVVLVYAMPSQQKPMTVGLPVSKKFVGQAPQCPVDDRNELARIFLQLVPQLCGFLAGHMPLVFFDLDRDVDKTVVPVQSGFMRPYQADAYRVYDSLAKHQRPQLAFVADPSQIPMSANARIAICVPMDCLLPLPHLVGPEAHYEANSKRALAFSGLPTPATEVLDTVLSPAQVSNPELVEGEVQRLVAHINKRAPPYVLKLPVAVASWGVFLVRTLADRKRAVHILRPEIRRMLQQITAGNAHLRPCAILLQAFVPSEAMALSFFVTRSGRAVFNACSHQLIDAADHYEGGYINYREQDKLRARYTATMDATAAYLHRLGYWGPAGTDVVTDSANGGRQLVVDLNARIACSGHPLGALHGHFQQRGLHVAEVRFPLTLCLTRSDFDLQFQEELFAGSLVINAWVHEPGKKTSVASLIWAAEDEGKLSLMRERLLKLVI